MALPNGTSGPLDGLHDVLIIGGGPVGLVCSLMLSKLGISHVLFERHNGTAIHPKAVGTNQRSMELYRRLGFADLVYKIACPPYHISKTGKP